MAQRNDIAILLYAAPGNSIDQVKTEHFKKNFKQVHLVKHGRDYDAELAKAQVLNTALEEITTPWVLYLESDESVQTVQFEDFKPEDKFVYAAAIQIVTQKSVERVQFQVRLFSKEDGFNFEGSALPHLNAALSAFGKDIFPDRLLIKKGNTTVAGVNLEKETKAHIHHAEAWLQLGLKYAGESSPKDSEKCFRNALQIGNLPDYDKAAALNGLADALFEQNKWHDCKKIARQSIELCEQQRMPYLVLFRSFYAANQWEDAYNHLYMYLEILAKGTKVNHDVIFPLVDTHFLLGEAAYKKGWHERALVHYEQYYELNEGKVSSDIIERLLIYALEIGEDKNAKMYFEALFKEKIPNKLAEDEKIKLLEVLTLFVDKEWFKLPLQIYEKLFKADESDSLVLRRWVAALIKARKIEEAQGLIAKHKTIFS